MSSVGLSCSRNEAARLGSTRWQTIRLAHGPGSWGDWFIPDTVWGLSIERACRIHDWSYHLGINKQLADIQFLQNMERIIMANTKWQWLKSLRLRRAKIYYTAVKFAGDSSFAKDNNNKVVNFT